jgi:hypothetical protein
MNVNNSFTKICIETLHMVLLYIANFKIKELRPLNVK